MLERAAERVAVMVPGVELAAARDFVARAVSIPTLRSLEAYLASHPDALTSGSSDMPVSVQTLAGLVAAAGHEGVRVPRCRRCAEQTLLRNQAEGGRVCNRCRRYVRSMPCAVCGTDRGIYSRDPQGNPLCSSCTRRKVEACGQCGLSRRVKTRSGDGSPICVNCYQAPKRTCCRCGVTAPTYAHTDQGPVCEACYQQPRRRCGGCGQARPIDRRARGTEPDLCGRCITRPRRACTICATSHPAHPGARQPVCLACRDAGHILEPDLTELPDRRRRRRHETAHDALRAKLRSVLCDPDHGIAEQLAPLTAVYDHVSNPATTMQWLHERRGAAGLLGELAVRAHTEPITHDLLDHYPQDQTLHHLRDLLVYAGVLPDPWLDNLLRGQPTHHAAILRPFATWHALRRARQRGRRREVTTSAATYVRSQIRIALQFLSWLDEHGTTLNTATQADLDQWLDSTSEYGYVLSSFITWATARRLCELTVSARPRSDPHLFLAEDDRWHTLRRCLHDDDLPMDVRVTGALVLLYGRTTTRIARLTTADLQRVDDETYLRFDEFTAFIPPSLATLLHRLPEAGSPVEQAGRPESVTEFLFPGRSPGRPSAAHVLARKLRAHGINPLPARGAARAAWAHDIPAPIAADLLGIHITTATKWAGRTRRDWTDYLVARAEHTPQNSHAPSGQTR